MRSPRRLQETLKKTLFSKTLVVLPRRGELRRIRPVSRRHGDDRGKAALRHYVEVFLEQHRYAIKGDVLEFGTSSYSRTYGSSVASVEVIGTSSEEPEVTLVADLVSGEGLPDGQHFDCIIMTQSLFLIHDLRGAIRRIADLLKPGGTLLATFPGIQATDFGPWTDHWRLTSGSAEHLFHEHFEKNDVDVCSYGNVLVAAATLYGLSTDDLRPYELDYVDSSFEVLVSVRATKNSTR